MASMMKRNEVWRYRAGNLYVFHVLYVFYPFTSIKTLFTSSGPDFLAIEYLHKPCLKVIKESWKMSPKQLFYVTENDEF